MMRGVYDMIWTFCRIVAWVLQLAGFAGIILGAVIAVRQFAYWLEP